MPIKPHYLFAGLALIVVAALIFMFPTASIGNYTGSGGQACWHIEGDWAYVYYPGSWDIFIGAQNRRMVHIDASKGLHISADQHNNVVLNQWVKTDGCYSIGSDANFWFWSDDSNIPDQMESTRPYVTGIVYDSTSVPSVPLQGADVILEGKQVSTDSAGRYTIYLNSPVSQTLMVSKSGYGGKSYTVSPNAQGQTSFDIDIGKVVSCTPSMTCTDYGACASGESVRICSDGCGTSRTDSQVCTDSTPVAQPPAGDTGTVEPVQPPSGSQPSSNPVIAWFQGIWLWIRGLFGG